MQRRYLGWIIAIAIVGVTLYFQKKNSSETKTSVTSEKSIKVGLVLDHGGKDDRSFNASAFKGVKKAEKELGIQMKYVEPTNEVAFEPSLRAFAQGKYDLIIGVGFSQKDAVEKVAKEYPNTDFVLIDTVTEEKNVRSVTFEEHEGSFLVGALAAMKSKTGTIGFIGGMEIPLIKRFMKGYEAGAKYINPKTRVLVNYIGMTPDAWRNPGKAKEKSLAQINQKADVIFSPSGASNLGVFDVAEEKNIFAIGVDSNQNWIKPGIILTSMLKNVDEAVYQSIQDKIEGKFTYGHVSLGLPEKAIGYALDEHNRSLISDKEEALLEKIKADIASGKIDVPDYYEIQKKTR